MPTEAKFGDDVSFCGPVCPGEGLLRARNQRSELETARGDVIAIQKSSKTDFESPDSEELTRQ